MSWTDNPLRAGTGGISGPGQESSVPPAILDEYRALCAQAEEATLQGIPVAQAVFLRLREIARMYSLTAEMDSES